MPRGDVTPRAHLIASESAEPIIWMETAGAVTEPTGKRAGDSDGGRRECGSERSGVTDSLRSSPAQSHRNRVESSPKIAKVMRNSQRNCGRVAIQGNSR